MKRSLSFPHYPLSIVIAFGMGLLATPKAEAQTHRPPKAVAPAPYQKKLLRLHNAERRKRKLPRLRLHAALNRASMNYAREMDANNHFDHTGPAPGFSKLDQRIRKTGGSTFTALGENIAMGQISTAEVTRGWMMSRGHRHNILNRRYKRAGFGKAGNPTYWVTNLGG